MKFLNIDAIISVNNSAGYIKSKKLNVDKIININGNHIPYVSCEISQFGRYGKTYYFIFNGLDKIKFIYDNLMDANSSLTKYNLNFYHEERLVKEKMIMTSFNWHNLTYKISFIPCK